MPNRLLILHAITFAFCLGLYACGSSPNDPTNYQAPLPACVPEGIAQADTFTITACGDGVTAVCSVVEGPGGRDAPLWDCTYGGLTCVEGCENNVQPPPAPYPAKDQPALSPCLYELSSRYPDHDQACKLLLDPRSSACAVELTFPDETLDHPAGNALYNGCIHADGQCVPSCIGDGGI